MIARPRPVDPEHESQAEYDSRLAAEAGLPGLGPLTELARELLEIRRSYVQAGGQL